MAGGGAVAGSTTNTGSGSAYGGTPIGNAYVQQPQQQPQQQPAQQAYSTPFMGQQASMQQQTPFGGGLGGGMPSKGLAGMGGGTDVIVHGMPVGGGGMQGGMQGGIQNDSFNSFPSPFQNPVMSMQSQQQMQQNNYAQQMGMPVYSGPAQTALTPEEQQQAQASGMAQGGIINAFL